MLSNFAKDLTNRLLKKKTERLNAKEAKMHFWFNRSLFGSPISDQLTKSDYTFRHPIAKFSQNTQLEEPEFRLERSLTNCKKAQYKQKDVGKDHLKKWIVGSDEEDVLIEIKSEGDDETESPFIESHKISNMAFID